MNEFKINDFLTLKLENRKTNIYVNGELFNQCYFIMLDISLEESVKFDKIDSIDEAADLLGWKEEGQERFGYNVDPESEFWGHCSNIQAWYEYDYDTRLLHSNLAFPLLIKLTEAGDPVAKKVLKDEIAKRFESGYPTVITYIIQENLLNYLNSEEQQQLINQSLPAILNTIEKFPEKTGFDLFSSLHRVALKNRLVEENFPALLEASIKISGRGKGKYIAFSELINSIKSTELLKKYYSLIESQLLILLGDIDKMTKWDKYDAFFDLLKAEEIIKLLKEHVPAFLTTIEKLPIEQYSIIIHNGGHPFPNEKYQAFWNLYSKGKTLKWKDKYFLPFLDFVDKFHDMYKYHAFHILIHSIKNTRLLQKYYSQNETQFLALVESIDKVADMDKYKAFSCLIEVAKITGLIKPHYSILMEIFPKLPDIGKLKDYYKRSAYRRLVEEFEGTDLENETFFLKWKEKNQEF